MSHTPLEIEMAYQSIVTNHQSREKSGLTEYEKILLVLHSQPKKIWWFSYELMGTHTIDGVSFFLGYETSARMTEMVASGVLRDRKVGRYTVKRLAALEAIPV